MRAKEITYTVPREQMTDFDPCAMVRDLAAAGFRFERETCPIKLAGDGGVCRNADGSVTFRQTVEGE